LNSDESNSSNQEVINEDDDEEEDQSQIPDWNWLINNYEKNENKTEEMSSHEVSISSTFFARFFRMNFWHQAKRN